MDILKRLDQFPWFWSSLNVWSILVFAHEIRTNQKYVSFSHKPSKITFIYYVSVYTPMKLNDHPKGFARGKNSEEKYRKQIVLLQTNWTFQQMTSFPFLGPSDLLPECSPLFANSQVQGHRTTCVYNVYVVWMLCRMVDNRAGLGYCPQDIGSAPPALVDGSSFGAARIDIPSSHVVDRSQRHKRYNSLALLNCSLDTVFQAGTSLRVVSFVNRVESMHCIISDMWPAA